MRLRAPRGQAGVWLGARRGMVPTMLGILPYAGLDIAAFELMHDRLQLAYGDPAAVPPAALLAAGMLSSTGAQLVAYPLGFVRTRLQARARPVTCSPRAHSPLFGCCAPALSAPARPGSLPPLTTSTASPVGGAVRSVCAACARRLSPWTVPAPRPEGSGCAQMDGRDGAPRQYRGMIDCFRQVACKEGLAGLYKARPRAATIRLSGTQAAGKHV